MASNPIPVSIPDLEVAGGTAKAGLLQYKDAIGLVHNTPENVAQSLTDMVMACGNYDDGKLELSSRKNVQRSVAASARAHAQITRDTLKPYLGAKHSEAWKGVGFRKSLRVPTVPSDLQSMMLSMKGWLTGHPDRQVEALNVTAVRSGALYDDMVSASNNIALQETTVAALTSAREEGVQAMRDRLRMLFNELEMKLDPMDERWLAFGFNRPGTTRRPGAPQHLHVALNGTNATLTWAATPRATYYRIWKKVVGVDEQAVAVGSPADLLFILNDLPLNATVEFSVSAVNDRGEGVRSKIVSVVVK